MKILVACADPTMVAHVQDTLEAEGHELFHAEASYQALGLFRSHSPDLILLDADLVDTELCRHLQGDAASPPRPVVVCIDSNRSELLEYFLDHGACEILRKPVDLNELRIRMRTMNTLASLHDQRFRHMGENAEELSVVKHVLERLVEPGQRMMPKGFHMETLRTNRISGDACAYSPGLPGIHFGLICDATGHGLLAGISTLPAVETFLGMTPKDLPLTEIYQQINTKLCRMLPTGRYACILLFRLDTNQGTLSVLNAGMPEALLLRHDGRIRAFPSRNFPAGVLSEREDTPPPLQTWVQPGDRFFAFSDGFTEAFSPSVVPSQLLHGGQDQWIHEHVQFIQGSLSRCVKDSERHDDISWALWEVPLPATEPLRKRSAFKNMNLLPGITFSIQVDPRLHETQSLMPEVLNLLRAQRVDQDSAQTLALLLTEAVANALEHGILGMDSHLKASEGFEAYEAERQARLKAIEAVQLQIQITLLEEPASGLVRRIQVDVEDPGQGFDWRRWMNLPIDNPHLPYGRGLGLLKMLGRDMTFNEAGNHLRFSVDCG